MFRKNYRKIKTMNVYKITHRERDHTKTWRTIYTLVPAESQHEALKKLDRHENTIKSIKLLGVQKEDTFEHWFAVWSEKIRNQKDDNRHAIYKIKSPSYYKKKN